jgi:hypothetical protein
MQSQHTVNRVTNTVQTQICKSTTVSAPRAANQNSGIGALRRACIFSKTYPILTGAYLVDVVVRQAFAVTMPQQGCSPLDFVAMAEGTQ